MGSTQSAEKEADNELVALFDPQEINELRRAYSRLANPTTGALDSDSLDALATGIPWSALWRVMAKAAGDGAPVRWAHFLGAIAASCKGRPKERIAAVTALYADEGGMLTAESLEALVRDSEVAARGGDASAPSAGTLVKAVVKDALLGGGTRL